MNGRGKMDRASWESRAGCSEGGMGGWEGLSGMTGVLDGKMGTRMGRWLA